MTGEHTYAAFGFSIVSDFKLPLVTGAAVSGSPVLRFSRASPQGDVASRQPASVGVRRPSESRICWLLPGVAALDLTRASEREIVCTGRGEEADIVHFFLRHGVPLALELYGGCWLNASGVVWNGEATLFVGPSGSGKSVGAAVMVSTGADLLSDHGISMLDFENGCPRATNGTGELQLWPDVLLRYPGLGPGRSIRPGVHKRACSVAAAGVGCFPVRRVFVESLQVSLTRSKLSPVRGHQRLTTVAACWSGWGPAGFHGICRWLESVEVWQVMRPSEPSAASLESLHEILTEILTVTT